MDLIKAIKSSKDVFVELVMDSTCLFVKVSKKDLLAQIKANPRFNDKELYEVQHFGKEALYLTTYYLTTYKI